MKRPSLALARSDGDGVRDGYVLDIQRMSTEDGPGLRTTVFLKGCTLACRWCHNPESIDARPRLVWHDWKCIGCDACDTVCEAGALRHVAGIVEIDAADCTLCGRCVDECPATALETVGTYWSAEALADEVARDASYFGIDGGVTVSGGEPAMQPHFVARFLGACRQRGLHTAVDTCGMCSPAAFSQVIADADLVLFDLKLLGRERHATLTNAANDRILENFLRLVGQAHDRERRREIWVRTPLIPGATAEEGNVAAIGAFLAKHAGGAVSRWELCAFNNLCADKYRRIGRAWDYAGVPLLAQRELTRLAAVARASGFAPERVRATGPCRVDCDDARAGAP